MAKELELKKQQTGRIIITLQTIKEYLRTYALPLIFGFIASKTMIFNSFSPFGIAAVGAAYITKTSLPFTLFGVALGYLFPISVSGIRYAFCTGLLFLMYGIAHYLSKKLIWLLYLMPGILCFTLSIGFVYLNGSSFIDYAFLFLESILCSCACYFMSNSIPALQKKGKVRDIKEIASICVLLCLILIGLDGYQFMGVNLGRIVSAIVVLLAVEKGGIYHGSIAGVIAGLAVSFQNPECAFLLGAFVFAGVGSGIFKELGAIAQAAAYTAAFACVILVNGNFPIEPIYYTEAFISALIFLLIPKIIRGSLENIFYKGENEKAKTNSVFLPYQKIKSASQAVLDLSKAVANKRRTNELINISSVFHLSCENICKRCSLRDTCWESGYDSIMNSFHSTISSLTQKGSISISDLPNNISSKCIRANQLVAAINKEYDVFISHKINQKIIDENNDMVVKQYETLSETMDNIADETMKNSDKIKDICKKTYEYLISNGVRSKKIECDIDKNGGIHINALISRNNSLPAIKEMLSKLSSHINTHITSAEITKADNNMVLLKFSQALPYRIESASLFKTKTGENICGDNASAFTPDHGKYILALSDGMGSGQIASQQSELTLSLVEKMLKSGFDMVKSASLINSALLMKNGGNIFATLDICQVDLQNGSVDFLKCCAAPTYILRSGTIYELKCSSLPIGINSEFTPIKSKATLIPDDIIIMVSDGVLEGEKEKFEAALKNITEFSPSNICKGIIEYCSKINNYQRADDMTIIVAKFLKNSFVS